jgi:hypothetical protein
MSTKEIFNQNNEPNLNCILQQIEVDFLRYDLQSFSFMGGGIFNISELHTNADVKVIFINLNTIIHNIEGANRNILYLNTGGLIIHQSISIASTVSIFLLNNISFNKLYIGAAPGNIVNAATALNIQLIRVQLK